MCSEGLVTISNYRDKDSSFFDEKEDEQEKVPDEELFFDYESGEYYTKEEFFNPDDEEEAERPKRKKRGLKIFIASFAAIALLSNVFSIWPRLFNLPAFEFIAVSQELSNNEDVQLYKESVVVVQAGNSQGTGYYISEEGYIMTNEHVINNDPQPIVSFQDGGNYAAEVVEENEELDVAILQIEPEESYPVLEVSTDWEENMPVYVIGNPLFFNYIANEGSIIGNMNTAGRESPVLMLDAPIYQGSSGSPVISHDGDVVGMVYATTRVEHGGSSTKVGLAIPAEQFEEYLP